ncbi:hypothetical protein N7456_006193 [Penicillium angulare]|uniref:Thioredoxin n=1 Tax=Penicillium angulare TaxID=116970 RepID=A0A9W9G043_9EURO|nr:hypothetical protein N7456_006193 [Penicillium angulare]
MPVLEVTSTTDFKEKILQSQDLVILDCYAEWCGPCKTIAPQMEKWSDQYTQIKFYKLDVEKVGEVAHELDVRAMPTFMLFKGGEKVTEIVGAEPTNIEEGIRSLLVEAP